MSVRCIRGAITVDRDAKEEVLSKTEIMLKEIIEKNKLRTEDIISILFTATNDIKSAYPAVAARGLGIVDAALMCTQELYIEGSLRMCIRAMVTVEINLSQKELNHVYLEGAAVLRPDLIKKNSKISVAVDGPAGSGKSTVAKLIAKECNLVYVDTGAMYRTVGLYCLENNINPDIHENVDKVIDSINISLKNTSGIQKIFLDGVDVTDTIRTQQVAAYASKVAAIPSVRKRLVKLQREIAENISVIMDGRDIGTNVLKNAEVKVYLDATVEERAKRRCNELREKRITPDFDQIVKEIAERDENDKNRECNPLTVASDAVIIDTTAMDIDEVKAYIADLIKKAR